MERTDELKERIRQQPLNDRLEESRRRIGDMCSKGRCPKMTIPVQYDDDDFYINTTLSDAQATIAALEETILKMGENAAVVAKDAMAAKEQVAALQARVRELEEITKVICGHCCEPMEIPSKAVLQSALTQRTAERDTARRRVDELEAREVDVVLLREDLEQRTALLEAAKRKVDLAEKKAWLSAHDVGFFSMWNGTDHSGPPKLALLCNDTFAWATADCEDVLDEQIDTIVELFKTEGEAGVIKWIAQQRNMTPMKSVGEWLYGCDAIKKQRDDLQTELERVRGEIAEKYKYHELFKQWQCWRDPDELVSEYEKYQAAIKENEILRALIAALPKVEGEISERFCTGSYYSSPYDYRSHVTFETALVALLKHRQGMEG